MNSAQPATSAGAGWHGCALRDACDRAIADWQAEWADHYPEGDK